MVARLRSSRGTFQPVLPVTQKRWENVRRLLKRAEQAAEILSIPDIGRTGMGFPEGCQETAGLNSCSLIKYHEISDPQEFYTKLNSLVMVTGQVFKK